MEPGDKGLRGRLVHARTTCDAMVGDQRVVLDVSSRTLHALRPDVSAVWPLLDGAATVDELVRDLAEAMAWSEDEARTTLQGWVGPLLEAGLVEFVSEPPA